MKKILIVTKNWIGDILFEFPAIEAIARKHPEAEIVCMSAPRCREVLEPHPAVSRIIPYDEKTSHRSWLKRFRFWNEIRREKFDAAYFFHRSRSRAFLLMAAGIPERIGFAAKKFNFLTRAVPSPDKPLHHADYFLDLLRKTGTPCDEGAKYSFYFRQEDQRRIQERLARENIKRFTCFHLGANWEPKRWPAGHFAKLADLLEEKYQLPVIVTGGPGDAGLGREFLEHVKSAKTFLWIGQTGLGELGALFSQAEFVVSGDSGPMHIASGTGAPVLALFGPTDPLQTGPRGKGKVKILSHVPKGFQTPWFGKDLPQEGWLSQISSEQAFKAIEEEGWLFSREISVSDGICKKTKDVLFVTLSNVGDVILTTPALMALVKNFPAARVTAVVGPRGRGVLEGSQFIDRIVTYDKKAPFSEKIAFVRKLRERGYEAVLDLRHTAIPYLVSTRRRSPLWRKSSHRSMREKHLSIARRMGLETAELPEFDFFQEDDLVSLGQKLAAKGVREERGWIVMSPLAASSQKSWKLEGFKELIQKNLDEFPHEIILAGGPAEKEAIDRLAAEFSSKVYSLAGETSLRELAALISRAGLLIANDSSAAQLAFELDTPAVIIFGPTDPGMFGRSGPHVRIVKQPFPCKPNASGECQLNHATCLDSLPAEKVFQACKEILSQSFLKEVLP